MPTSLQSRAILQRLTETAVAESLAVFDRFSGPPEVVRAALLESVPAEIAYFSDGSAALAADTYEEERELAKVASRFAALPVVLDRTVKVRRAIAWVAEPLFLVEPNRLLVGSRLAEVIQFEVARPNRDTTLENRRRDPAAAGWRRIARGGACKFCLMLAARGAVYRQASVTFAAHPACHCVAQPVFSTDDTVEASVVQYTASKRNQTPAQKANLKQYLADNFS